MSACSHGGVTVTTAPRAKTCESCGTDEQLRACTACGHVGCASTRDGHADAHVAATGHQVIKEIAPHDDGFVWCYACGAYLA